MEPDHSATLMELLLRYPDVKIVCNQKILTMIDQFFNMDLSKKAFVVKEGDTLNTGHHVLKFIFAPMVHWPEVMVTFDETTRTLFSADAFGTFGALNGALMVQNDFEAAKSMWEGSSVKFWNSVLIRASLALAPPIITS